MYNFLFFLSFYLVHIMWNVIELQKKKARGKNMYNIKKGSINTNTKWWQPHIFSIMKHFYKFIKFFFLSILLIFVKLLWKLFGKINNLKMDAVATSKYVSVLIFFCFRVGHFVFYRKKIATRWSHPGKAKFTKYSLQILLYYY